MAGRHKSSGEVTAADRTEEYYQRVASDLIDQIKHGPAPLDAGVGTRSPGAWVKDPPSGLARRPSSSHATQVDSGAWVTARKARLREVGRDPLQAQIVGPDRSSKRIILSGSPGW